MIDVFKDGTGHDEENHAFVERIVKTLLWVRGGYKIIIAGSKVVGEKIKEAYVAAEKLKQALNASVNMQTG